MFIFPTPENNHILSKPRKDSLGVPLFQSYAHTFVVMAIFSYKVM